MKPSASSAPPSRFRSNVLRIATGTVASQALVIGATPLLSRLYGPDAFGELAVFTALNTVLAGLFTLKYELSIMLPSDTAEAIRLTELTLTSSSLFAALLGAGLGLAQALGSSNLPTYVFALPLGCLLVAAYSCAQQWAARDNDYRRFSQSQVVGALVNVLVSLVLGLAACAPSAGLVVGWVLGLAASLIYAIAEMSPRTIRFPSWYEILAAAWSYRRFPHFVLPSSMAQTLGNSSQPFILQALFSLREVGHYAIANRFMLAPSTLVGSAVAEAFRAEFVDRTKRGEALKPFFRATLARMLLMGLPVFALMLVAAPGLFELALGVDYREAGTLARHLSAGVFAQFVAQPFGHVFVATGKVRQGLVIQTMATLLPLTAIGYGGLSSDILLAFGLASASSCCLCCVLVALAYRACEGGLAEAAPSAAPR